MAEVVNPTVTPAASTHGRRGRNVGTVSTIAWRNLWRNRRRTWLTSGGIAFSVWLLVVAISMQDGTFEIMIDNGARLALGHIQIQHPDYQNDPRLEYTFTGSTALVESLSGMEGVAVIFPIPLIGPQRQRGYIGLLQALERSRQHPQKGIAHDRRTQDQDTVKQGFPNHW